MYNITVKRPLQLFVNGKFVCDIEEAQLIYQAPYFKKKNPKSGLGTVINIIKSQPPTEEDLKLQEENDKESSYDEFYKHMNKIPEFKEEINW